MQTARHLRAFLSRYECENSRRIIICVLTQLRQIDIECREECVEIFRSNSLSVDTKSSQLTNAFSQRQR